MRRELHALLLLLAFLTPLSNGTADTARFLHLERTSLAKLDDPRSARARPCVVRARVQGIINTATTAYLTRAIASAQSENCSAVLVSLDTPGGLMDAMRDIVSAFLGAPLPVLVHVEPSGARAGSAGMFITLAAHVAAMAPGTNIGAAHPVLVGAGGVEADSEMARKAENDAAALARAIAGERSRNAEWAELAVRESASLTANEALSKKVIDLLAHTTDELLDQADGRQVLVAGEPTPLRTRGARLLDHQMTIQQRALHLLGDPNVTYLLFMIGLLGLVIELYNPGLFIPGGLGVLLLLLGAVGMNILPVNVAGVVLLVVAVGLFIGELYTSTSGLLTLAGLAALLAGAALLLDRESPDFFADADVRLSWGLVLPLALLLTLASGLLAWHARRTAQAGPTTGREALVGAMGRALTRVDAQGGTALVQGERWQAVSEHPIDPGETLCVMGVERLTLTVAQADSRASTRKPPPDPPPRA